MGASLETKSIVDAVYEVLWERLVTGGVPLGSLLTEQSVANEFGVARPTAKAAVERLVSDGLLVRDGRRRTHVLSLTRYAIRDVYASRLFVERPINEALAARGVGVPRAATDAIDAMLRHADAGEAAQVIAADVAFHRALVETYGSERVSRMHALVMAEAHVCMGQVQSHQLLSARTIAGEHAGIVAAIERGDGPAAARLSHEHLARAEATLLRNLFDDSSSEMADT